MVKHKEVPLYATFLFAGLNVVILSYLETFVSSEVSNIVYSLPVDLLIILSFLLLAGKPIKKISKVVLLSGFYGQLGAICFLMSFIFLTNYKEMSIIVSAIISLLIWCLYNYFFIYL